MPASRKPLRAQEAGIARTAGAARRVRIVATVRQCEGHAQFLAETHDIGFGESDERSANCDAGAAFHAGFGGQITHALEGPDVFGAAIGVAGIIESVDADEDVVGFENLGPGEGEGEEDGVPRGYVGDRDPATHGPFVAAFGDGDFVRERGMAEHAEIDSGHAMIGCAKGGRHLFGRVEFDAMTLAVVEGKRITIESVKARRGEAGGGIESSAEEANGFHGRVGRSNPIISAEGMRRFSGKIGRRWTIPCDSRKSSAARRGSCREPKARGRFH